MSLKQPRSLRNESEVFSVNMFLYESEVFSMNMFLFFLRSEVIVNELSWQNVIPIPLHRLCFEKVRFHFILLM